MDKYKGYEWGWITKDGARHPSSSAVTTEKIMGVWSKVYREDIEISFYHEVFLEEYRKSDKGSWGERPLAMLLKMGLRQACKLAYYDKTGDAMSEEEIITLPELFCSTTRKLQLWKCKSCGHTFYTLLGQKEAWHQRIYARLLRSIGSPAYIECESCSEMSAAKVKVVTKKIRE